MQLWLRRNHSQAVRSDDPRSISERNRKPEHRQHFGEPEPDLRQQRQPELEQPERHWRQPESGQPGQRNQPERKPL